MSILKRMRDITVASLNEMLEQSEDPVRLIDQYLMEQREQIKQSEHLYQQCLVHSQTLRQQYVSAEQMKEKREQQAMMAMKAEEDGVARLILQEKLQHEEKAEQYRSLYEQTLPSLQELELQLSQMKADYDEVAAKRSFYMARMESIRLQQRMNERMSHVSTGNGASGMFNRLEERVSNLELEAKSLRDVRQATRSSLYGVAATVSNALEHEMQRLRKKLEQEGRS